MYNYTVFLLLSLYINGQEMGNQPTSDDTNVINVTDLVNYTHYLDCLGDEKNGKGPEFCHNFMFNVPKFVAKSDFFIKMKNKVIGNY